MITRLHCSKEMTPFTFIFTSTRTFFLQNFFHVLYVEALCVHLTTPESGNETTLRHQPSSEFTGKLLRELETSSRFSIWITPYLSLPSAPGRINVARWGHREDFEASTTGDPPAPARFFAGVVTTRVRPVVGLARWLYLSRDRQHWRCTCAKTWASISQYSAQQRWLSVPLFT